MLFFIMVEVAPTVTEVINNTPYERLVSLEGLILILQAAGVVFILYVIYAVIMAIVNIRRMRILGKIDKRMEVLEEKIDSLTKTNNKKKKR